MTSKHTPGPLKLYPHTTDGGACYLTDKYILCPNGEKKGVFEGASVIVRLDGEPEITLSATLAAAPDLLEALRDVLAADDEGYDLPWGTVRAAIAKAESR